MSIQLTNDQIQINIEALVSVGKLKQNISAMLRNDYELFCNGNAEAETAIVAFWNACESAGVLSTVRQQLSKASKDVHESLGVNVGQGAKVENGKLVLAAKRNRETKNPLVETAKELAKTLSSEQQAALAKVLASAVESL